MGLLARGLKLSDVRRDMWVVVKFKTVKQNNSFRAQVRNMRRNATRFISYTP